MNRIRVSVMAVTIACLGVGIWQWVPHGEMRTHPEPEGMPTDRVQTRSRHGLITRTENRPRRYERASDWMGIPESEWHDLERREELKLAFCQWSRGREEEAMRVLEQFPEVLRGELAYAVAAGLIQDQPNEAWRFLEMMTDLALRQAMMKQLLMDYAERNPQAALEWALNLGVAEDAEEWQAREWAIASVVVGYANEEPSKAMALAQTHLAQSGYYEKTTVEIVQRWVQKDPLQAVAYVTEMTEGRLKETALANVIRIWHTQDREGLNNWLALIADEALRTRCEGYLRP